MSETMKRQKYKLCIYYNHSDKESQFVSWNYIFYVILILSGVY